MKPASEASSVVLVHAPFFLAASSELGQRSGRHPNEETSDRAWELGEHSRASLTGGSTADSELLTEQGRGNGPDAALAALDWIWPVRSTCTAAVCPLRSGRVPRQHGHREPPLLQITGHSKQLALLRHVILSSGDTICAAFPRL